MKRYKVIQGRLTEVEEQINKLTQEGWDLVGGITSATQGSIIKYAQSLCIDMEEPLIETPKPKRTRKKKQ